MKRWIKRSAVALIALDLLASLITLNFAHAVISKSPKQAASANPYGNTPIDPPGKNDPLLVVTNSAPAQKASGGSGAARSTSYRMADLLHFKHQVITINEPFAKKVQSFTVISLKDIFASAGIRANQRVQTIALNDYIYSNTAGSFTKAQGYLAIERGGKAIPYDQGGPIRIIFPNSSNWSKVLDPWNWSLAKIVAQ